MEMSDEIDRPMAPTARQLLADKVVLSLTEVAFVLGLVVTRGANKGKPRPADVVALVESGQLRLVNPSIPKRCRGRWRIQSDDVVAYLAGQPQGS